MPKRDKPSVNARPVAGRYEGPREKIIEFSSPAGGGLVSFQLKDDGTLWIGVYRADPEVRVHLMPTSYDEQPPAREV